MIILVCSVIIFLLFFIHERILLTRRINSIPLRISVTGTRGKSNVVRILASVLREDGRIVLAKTTGSQAQYILPNEEEIEIPRRGITSIIEQKKLIKKAVEVQADCMVAEIMSIHPEYHYVESKQLLKPNVVVITNVRCDHTDAMGQTKDEIASVLCLDIPEKAKVFIPGKEYRPVFQSTVNEAGGELITVQEGLAYSLLQLSPELARREFSENIDLVYALGQHLNIEQETILNGMLKVKHDIGAVKIWQYRSSKTQKIYYLVNAFAANDPESTLRVISKIKEILPSVSDNLIGLFSLRSDRGDRTLQWIEALKTGAFECFNKFYVTGIHSKIVKRKLKWVNVLKNELPEKIMETIIAEVEAPAMIFGFGNMEGTGRLMVVHWNKIGDEYGL